MSRLIHPRVLLMDSPDLDFALSEQLHVPVCLPFRVERLGIQMKHQ